MHTQHGHNNTPPSVRQITCMLHRQHQHSTLSTVFAHLSSSHVDDTKLVGLKWVRAVQDFQGPCQRTIGIGQLCSPSTTHQNTCYARHQVSACGTEGVVPVFQPHTAHWWVKKKEHDDTNAPHAHSSKPPPVLSRTTYVSPRSACIRLQFVHSHQ